MEQMFDLAGTWNVSFAGCGFSSIYYLGALSCVLQQLPQLVHGATRICGASSGCLVAAALTVGVPIEQLCADVLTLAAEARKHPLGVFHPAFSLLREVRNSLLQKLPADAHLRASRRLCVSLTRLADGQNVLVSQFDSREELVQVLVCSCFFPVYCGFIPPSYRGVYYMDGALSNNMPLFEQRNTITVAPFSGESDICPREGAFTVVQVHYGNMSIQVNTGNLHRICSSFLPPRLEKLAEICHSGYLDALRFLRERDLLGTQLVPPSVEPQTGTVKPCCRQNPHQGDHRWLDPRVIENLPLNIQKVLCEACRVAHDGSRPLLMDLLTWLLLPVELAVVLITSMMSSGCAAVRRLCSHSWNCRSQQVHSSSPSSNNTLHQNDLGPAPLTSSVSTHKTPANGKVTLHHRSKSSLSAAS